MNLQFSALSQNESFARVTVAAFIAQLDPTMEELTEIKTVVSEAVTNAIIHGYEGVVYISVILEEAMVKLTIRDEGIGIFNLDEARQPLFTTKPELERSGMGFTIMENFMDEVEVISNESFGTTIHLTKYLSNSNALCN